MNSKSFILGEKADFSEENCDFFANELTRFLI